MSGLQPLVEPCLRQTLKSLPRPETWNALGPVPTACLLFLDAYYQAWSQQVSVACLLATRPCLPRNTAPLFSLSVSTSPLLPPHSHHFLLSTFSLLLFFLCPPPYPLELPKSRAGGIREPQAVAQLPCPFMPSGPVGSSLPPEGSKGRSPETLPPSGLSESWAWPGYTGPGRMGVLMSAQ